jgi:hypothetical protein
MHIRVIRLNIVILVLKVSILMPIPEVVIFCPESAIVNTVHYFWITTQLIVFTMICLSRVNNASNVKIHNFRNRMRVSYTEMLQELFQRYAFL